MQLGVVGQQLDVPGLQEDIQSQLVAERERVVQSDGFHLLPAKSWDLRMALRQLVVGRQVGRAQITLHASSKGEW